MGIFDNSDLTTKEKAERDLPLADILKANEIVQLWSDDHRQQSILLEQIKKAIGCKKLIIQPHKIYSPDSKNPEIITNFLKVYEDGGNIFARWTNSNDEWTYEEEPVKISKQDFIGWLNIENEHLPTGCLLQKWWNDTQQEIQAVGNDAEVGQEKVKPIERELTKWFRETWINEGKPGGTVFFDSLKKYTKKNGSPITEYYTTSKNGAGIKWSTGNASGEMTKKAIQNKVSKFKKESQ